MTFEYLLTKLVTLVFQRTNQPYTKEQNISTLQNIYVINENGNRKANQILQNAYLIIYSISFGNLKYCSHICSRIT